MDKAKIDEIYRKNAAIIYKYLCGLTQDTQLAEELTQETFYQAYLHIGQFEGRCEIDTWLCQIAKNAYYKEMKRHKRYSSPEILDKMSVPDAFQKVENRDQAMNLHKILHQMKEPYREVFSLKVFGELTFKEIAAIFNKTESWAKMTYYRAKAQLVQKMEVQNGKK